MDRENHIVVDDDCRKKAAVFVPFADEAFLVTLANKGLYKRALKDYDAVALRTIAPNGENLAVTLDDVCVVLSADITQSTCDCPSKTICKHILMAVLCAAEAAQMVSAKEEIPPPDSTTTEPFVALAQADLDLLRKQAGKRVFDDALRLVQEGWQVTFTEGEMLAAVIDFENITVYFPKVDSISRAICKCGETGLCRHKLTALLAYVSQTRGLTGNGEPVGLLSLETLTLLEAADAFIVKILDKGVVCVGETDSESAVQYAIRLEAQGLGNLSRAFRGLSGDFENLIGKNAAFSQMGVFAALARLHNTMSCLIRHPEDGALASVLIEASRSEYHTTPSGTFTGLGAYPWQTRSGFFGITAFLYHHEQQRVCTYTTSMADYYEHTAGYSNMNSLSAQLMRNDHWSTGLSLHTISSSSFVLNGFKSNFQNRISSGKQTMCEIIEKTALKQVASLPLALAIGALHELKPKPFAYFGKRQPEEPIAIRCCCFHEMVFDRVGQKLSFAFVDEQGGRINGELAYSELTEPAIRTLEMLGRLENFTGRYFLCLRRGRVLVPVSMVSENGVENFYFR